MYFFSSWKITSWSKQNFLWYGSYVTPTWCISCNARCVGETLKLKLEYKRASNKLKEHLKRNNKQNHYVIIKYVYENAMKSYKVNASGHISSYILDYQLLFPFLILYGITGLVSSHIVKVNSSGSLILDISVTIQAKIKELFCYQKKKKYVAWHCSQAWCRNTLKAQSPGEFW